MHIIRAGTVVGCWIALAFVVGCSGGPKMVDVHGMVTLDGKPLSNGTLRLVPQDGQSATIGGSIENGEFDVRVQLVNYRVEISSTQLSINAKPVDRHDLANAPVEQLIPEKYNTKSELVLEVQPGLNDPHFDLISGRS